MLAPHPAAAERRCLLARALQDAADVRSRLQRRRLRRQASEAPVDGLARETEVARDRRERRAVGEGTRDLPALERLEFVAGSLSRRRAARGVGAPAISAASSASRVRCPSLLTTPAAREGGTVSGDCREGLPASQPPEEGTLLSRFHLAAAAAMLSCALMLGAASTAGAQTPTQDLTKKIDVTGTAKNGKKFKGTYTINRFISRGDSVLVGKLTGRLKHRRVSRTGVRIPVTGFAEQGAAQRRSPVCRILTLTLGPLDLNLLGLRIQLNQVNLRITAIPADGLLGDLLCSITNLLNPPALLGSNLAAVLERDLDARAHERPGGRSDRAFTAPVTADAPCHGRDRRSGASRPRPVSSARGCPLAAAVPLLVLVLAACGPGAKTAARGRRTVPR